MIQFSLNQPKAKEFTRQEVVESNMNRFSTVKNNNRQRQHRVMDSRTVRDTRNSQSLPANDLMACLTQERSDLVKKRQEIVKHDAEMEQHKQVRESRKQRIDELQKKFNKALESGSRYDLFLIDEEADEIAEEAERESQECLQMEAELQRMKEDYAKVVERNQKLQCEIQKRKVYWDRLEQAAKMTKFEVVQELIHHVETLQWWKEQYHQRLFEADEKADKLRKELQSVEEQHHLTRLQMTHELSLLEPEELDLRSEVQKWEMECNHILETTSKQHLQLAQTDMATIDIYEMIKGKLNNEDTVDMDDTNTMLDKIQMFILDNNKLLKQYQTTLESHSHEKKQRKRDKDIAPTPLPPISNTVKYKSKETSGRQRTLGEEGSNTLSKVSGDSLPRYASEKTQSTKPKVENRRCTSKSSPQKK